MIIIISIEQRSHLVDCFFCTLNPKIGESVCHRKMYWIYVCEHCKNESHTIITMYLRFEFFFVFAHKLHIVRHRFSSIYMTIRRKRKKNLLLARICTAFICHFSKKIDIFPFTFTILSNDLSPFFFSMRLLHSNSFTMEILWKLYFFPHINAYVCIFLCFLSNWIRMHLSYIYFSCWWFRGCCCRCYYYCWRYCIQFVRNILTERCTFMCCVNKISLWLQL